MNWEQLLSLRRQGDTNKRLRIEQDETRLGFEVDYDRIIFSSAFRSLQDKTQVIPLSKTSFVHTRLTHSLEVSVVGRSLCRIIGKAVLEKYPHVFWEHIYDIIRHEKPEGVIVQLGGQTALKLAEKLTKYGVKIIGTSFESLDLAEDRGSFSKLLKENNIPYPEFGVAENADQALVLADQLDFPILVRPSYVLGGQGMKIVINKEELVEHVVDLIRKIPNNKLLLDHYLDGAIEAEADAICDAEGNVYIIGIMEHIEPCGIHSGDSNATLPAFNLGDLVMQQIIDHTHTIARALNTIGLINIQFAIKEEMVYIIEANPRASRTVPFIAKAYKEPYVNYATKVMLGEKMVTDFNFNPQLQGYAIKQPVFSFNKFPNVDKRLGPEMKSTGESILFIDSLKDDQFYDLYSRRKMYLSK